jgi:hypothetical protein
MCEGLDSAQKSGAPFGPSQRYHDIGRWLGHNKHLFFFWWEDWNNIPHTRTFNTHPQPNHGVNFKLRSFRKRAPKKIEKEIFKTINQKNSFRDAKNYENKTISNYRSLNSRTLLQLNAKIFKVNYYLSSNKKRNIINEAEILTQTQTTFYNISILDLIWKFREDLELLKMNYFSTQTCSGTINFSDQKLVFQYEVNEVHNFQRPMIWINTMTIRRYIKPLMKFEPSKNSYRKK